MGIASLGNLPFRIDPRSVSWQFQMKVSHQRTVGGDVVQVYGTQLGDMTVTGVFGYGDRARGDVAGWQDQERFRRQVESWVDASVRTSGGRPIRFLYPPRRWDLQVLVRAYTGPDGPAVTHDNATFNPSWTLVLFVVQDSTRRVVSGIRDLYISRLMNGVGWKQSAYNGPMTQAEVDKTLAPFGGDLHGYLAEQFNQAAGVSSAPPTTQGPGATVSQPNGVEGWVDEAQRVLGVTFTASERQAIGIIIDHESGGNPQAVNNSDSNARAGHPTKGLMQMRDDTFAAHALPGHGNILDPVDNLVSDYGYVTSKYDSYDQVPGVVAVRAGRRYVGY